MLHKLRAALVTLIMVAVGVIAVQSPALAAFSCPGGDICTYDNANGGGFRYDYGENIGVGCWNNGRATTTSSAANRRAGWRVKFWSHSDCWLPGQGVVTSWVYNGGDINFGLMDNQVWSFRLENCAPC